MGVAYSHLSSPRCYWQTVPPPWDGGRLFGALAFFFLRKRPLLETKNRSQGAKWTVSLRATNKPLTKFGVQWQKTDFLAENQVFGSKKGKIVIHLLSIEILGSFWDGMWSFGMDPKLRPSQTPTIHPSQFFWHIKPSVPEWKSFTWFC